MLHSNLGDVENKKADTEVKELIPDKNVVKGYNTWNK